VLATVASFLIAVYVGYLDVMWRDVYKPKEETETCVKIHTVMARQVINITCLVEILEELVNEVM